MKNKTTTSLNLILMMIFSFIGYEVKSEIFNPNGESNLETHLIFNEFSAMIPILFTHVTSDNISFYKVPLVCKAASHIGCGSRSKPILLDLEKSEDIKEAWLNRQGTVIAVVWYENSTLEARKDVVTEVFATNKVNASELMLDDYSTNLASFSSKKGWYKGSDVNALSKEEAGIFADKLMVSIKNNAPLNDTDEASLKKDIQDIFYDFFVNYETLDQLGNPDVYKEKLKDVIKSGEKYVGEGNMPSINALWRVCSSGTKSDCKKTSACKYSKSL